MLTRWLASMSFILYVTTCHAQTTMSISSAPPAQASAAGFTKLVFSDYFTQLNLNSAPAAVNGEVWTPGHIYISPLPCCYVVNTGSGDNGGLTMTNVVPAPGFTLIATHPLTHTLNSGTTFLYGYFEARIRYRTGSGIQTGATNNFGAFYLSSQSFYEQTDGFPGNEEYCEIDISEMAGTHFKDNPELHDWTVISGVRGGLVKPNILTTPPAGIDPMDGKFHTYGVLWQSGTLSWYVDNNLELTQTSYTICNNDYQLLNVQGGTHTSDVQITDVQFVRVWH